MNEDSKGQYWLRSGLLTIFQNFSGVFLAFASFFFLVRLLSKHDFGTWTLFMTTITILETVRNGLIQSALVKFVAAAEKEEHPKIITASFTISGISTIVCMVANFCFAPLLADLWDSPELTRLFYFYNFTFLISGVFTQFNCIETANLDFKGVFVTNLVRQGSFFAYILIVYLFDLQLELLCLVWAQIFSAVVSVVPAYFYVRSSLAFTKLSDVFKDGALWIKKLFGYGKYAFGTSVSALLSGTVDQMMLGAMLSPAASGAFNIAVRITNLIDIPTNAMAVIVFPQSAKRMATEGKDAIKYLYEKSVGTTLAILFPGVVFLYFCADWVIWLIAGEKYADSIPLLRVTLLYCLLIPFGRQFGTVLDSMGRTKVNFYLVVCTAALNLGLNYFMIGEFGVMGAAYATLCANVVGFVVAQRILSREVGVNVLNSFIYMWRFYPDFYERYVKPRFSKDK
jgi:lipopolysaccharide exporter